MTDVDAGTLPAVSTRDARGLRRPRLLFANPVRRTLAAVLWIALWWIVVITFGVSKDFLPTPSEVARRIVVLSYEPLGAGTLWWHAWTSIVRLTSGFLAAVVIGVPLGLSMALVRPINYLVRPLFELFRYVPPIAWAPFAIFWFGAGNNAQAYVIFTAAFPPVLINAYRGGADD